MTAIQERMMLDSVAALRAAFDELGTEVATKIGVKANRDAANLLKARLIVAAPFDPNHKPTMRRRKDGSVSITDYGHLRANIGARRQKAVKQGHIVFNVTTGKAFWGSFVEFGTAKAPPHPWWRPTLEQMKGDLLAAQMSGLSIGIEKAARKASRLKR